MSTKTVVSEPEEVQSEDEEMETIYEFPCMLTVERSKPLNIGKYKESKFSMQVNGVESVYLDDDNILTIEYILDGSKTIKRIPRENIVEWDVQQFEPIPLVIATPEA